MSTAERARHSTPQIRLQVSAALLHQGVLSLAGDPARGLAWTVQCNDLTRRVRGEIAAIAAEAQARAVEVRAESEFLDSADNTTGVETPRR